MIKIPSENENVERYASQYIKALQRQINDGDLLPELIVGCTQTEIRNLEQRLNTNIPEFYRAYLLVEGHGPGINTVEGFTQFVDLTTHQKQFTYNLTQAVSFDGKNMFCFNHEADLNNIFDVTTERGRRFRFYTDGEEDDFYEMPNDFVSMIVDYKTSIAYKTEREAYWLGELIEAFRKTSMLIYTEQHFQGRYHFSETEETRITRKKLYHAHSEQSFDHEGRIYWFTTNDKRGRLIIKPSLNYIFDWYNNYESIPFKRSKDLCEANLSDPYPF